MSVSATVSLRADQFEFGEVLAVDGARRIELLRSASFGSPRLPYVRAEGPRLGEFESALRTDSRVEALVRIEAAENRRLYRIELADPERGFVGLLSAYELIVERGQCHGDTWTFRLRASGTGVLSAFQADCLDRGIRFEVRRLSTESNTDRRYDLTRKQREAIELAFEKGYFRVPRETSLTALADQMGISRQALSRRLSRGLHALLRDTLFQ